MEPLRRADCRSLNSARREWGGGKGLHAPAGVFTFPRGSTRASARFLLITPADAEKVLRQVVRKFCVFPVLVFSSKGWRLATGKTAPPFPSPPLLLRCFFFRSRSRLSFFPNTAKPHCLSFFPSSGFGAIPAVVSSTYTRACSLGCILKVVFKSRPPHGF